MVKEILTDQAFAVIVSAAITAIGAVLVSLVSKKKAKSDRVKKIDDFAGYREYAEYLKTEFRSFREETNIRIKQYEIRVDELEAELNNERKQNKLRLDKLLRVSRKYNIDIRDVL